LLFEESANGIARAEIELSAGAGEEVRVAGALELAKNRAARQAPVPGYEDGVRGIHSDQSAEGISGMDANELS
jgi:hypothetical protein